MNTMFTSHPHGFIRHASTALSMPGGSSGHVLRAFASFVDRNQNLSNWRTKLVGCTHNADEQAPKKVST